MDRLVKETRFDRRIQIQSYQYAPAVRLTDSRTASTPTITRSTSPATASTRA